MAKIQDCVEKSEDIKKHSYGREDSKGRLSKLCIWNLAGNDVLGMAVRSQKIAGTAQELMGGEEIYHYHSKVCLSLKDNWEFVTIKMFYQLMMKEARTGGAWNWHQVEYQSGISHIYHAQWTRVPHLLSRTMDIGTEMDACYQRWHPSSWQLTSKKDLAALWMF